MAYHSHRESLPFKGGPEIMEMKLSMRFRQLCPVCGKEIELLHDHSWANFKVTDRTLACAQCMREFGDIDSPSPLTSEE